MKKIHPKHLPMEVLIKYKNSSNVDYVIQRKKIIQGFIINKIEIIHAKNVCFFFFFFTLCDHPEGVEAIVMFSYEII